MSYRSLYRRWRPVKFNQVVGQEHITRMLQNALLRGNVSHAYLFCGPRGTGKTTVAKILARAVNCSNLSQATEPCGECSSCQHIMDGSSMDVLELDAASNRGIDEVRDLREKTRYVATQGQYKVYIIDEVHMLTHEAFNALLKTLEEPPPGVIFILATTDPSKLPATVISRCQRLDFRLLTLAEIKERIEEVANQEDWPFEEEALLLIARLCEGAMRDALGLLEQAYALGEGRVIMENVYILTGLAKEEAVGRVVEALVKEDIVGGLTVVREIAFGGKDLYLFLKEQMVFFKQLLVAQSAGFKALEDKRYEKYLRQYRDIFSGDVLLEIITLLHRATGEIRFSDHAYFILEITFLNMLKAAKNSAADMSGEQLTRRIEKPEGRPTLARTEQRSSAQPAGLYAGEKSGGADTRTETAEEVVVEKSSRASKPEKALPFSEEPSISMDHSCTSARQLYSEIIGLLKNEKKLASTLALFEMVHPESLTRKCLTLSYDHKLTFLKDKLTEPGRLKLLEKVAAQLAGREMHIRLVAGAGSKAEEDGETEEADREKGKTGSLEDIPGRMPEKEFRPTAAPEEEPPLVPEEELRPMAAPNEEPRSVEAEDKGHQSSFSEKEQARDEFIFNEALKLFEGKIFESEN